jgi:hypothetical protein
MIFKISDCEVAVADHVGGDEGRIDWDTIQIIEIIDEEGRLEVASKDQLFAILRLKVGEERAKRIEKLQLNVALKELILLLVLMLVMQSYP